jgi:general stress protein YciG
VEIFFNEKAPLDGDKRRTQMAGTKAGGQKAAAKNLQRDPDFYAKIGRKGGKNGHTGGFAANPELARIAGARGGRISRRTKKTVA